MKNNAIYFITREGIITGNMSSIHMKVGLADGREQLTRNITMLQVKSIFTIFNLNETKSVADYTGTMQ